MTTTATEAVLEVGGDGMSRLMEQVEARISELACDCGSPLDGPAGDTLRAGGKRLRPLLVCLAAGVPVPESPALVRAAASVELIHAATLVHDDVLDRATRRRGRPTVVASAGRAIATATGDLLFSRALAELAATGSVAAVRTLSGACAELASGELMQRADAYRLDVGVERYLERCRLKTGVLFGAACKLGALIAGDRAELLHGFGEGIGVAFQILDDVLDVSGPPERTGKPRGTDFLDGTVNLPLILARRLDPALAGFELRSVRTPEQAAAVCDQVIATGALAQCRQRALGLVQDVKTLLPSLQERQRLALELVADGVVERYA